MDPARQLNCPPIPCNTCPYRRDTPSGIWAPEEYAKLPEYDREDNQPIALFHCHNEGAIGKPTVCRGWVSCHQFDSIAIRLAVCKERLTADQVTASCSVPLYSSGAEACAAGLKDVRRPGRAARAAIAKLTRQRSRSPQKEAKR
jgi:Family of unknown function (DUF6283)